MLVQDAGKIGARNAQVLGSLGDAETSQLFFEYGARMCGIVHVAIWLFLGMELTKLGLRASSHPSLCQCGLAHVGQLMWLTPAFRPNWRQPP